MIFKCEILKEASILRVSTLEEDIAAQVEPIESSLDYIVPGSRLNFIYEKVRLNVRMLIFFMKESIAGN